MTAFPEITMRNCDACKIYKVEQGIPFQRRTYTYVVAGPLANPLLLSKIKGKVPFLAPFTLFYLSFIKF